jgi:hypothetical protein
MVQKFALSAVLFSLLIAIDGWQRRDCIAGYGGDERKGCLSEFLNNLKHGCDKRRLLSALK